MSRGLTSAIVASTFALAACGVLSAADKAIIAQDASTIARCQSLGLACKADGGADCYASAYDPCMREGGLR